MEAASIEKVDRICRRLKLAPGDRVLEIGTGWGALACYAAEHYGCHVTTTTISAQQYDFASNLVKKRGLSDKVTVLKKDYRHLEGQFNKIISVEMIEAVGHQYYDTFFETCKNLLTEDGQMAIQSIVIKDDRYDFHVNNVDFISQFIFPGESLPSISKLAEVASRSGDMCTAELVDITQHYAETLRRWRAEFLGQLPAVRALGYGDAFIRLWHYYLCYCEAGFEERQINTVQVIYIKKKSTYDPLSDRSSDNNNKNEVIR